MNDKNIIKIRKRIDEIKRESGDDETAHVLEDSLFEFVLNLIASGCSNPQELAIEALKSCDIEFDRWYA